MAGRLKGKTALIIGAGQTPGAQTGNGRAMAERFAAEGAIVACADRLAARAEETAEAITAQGGRAFPLTGNITQAPDCARLVAEAEANAGPLDILVNNAGIGGGGPADKLDEEIFTRVLDVNLMGMWRVTKAALRGMKSRKAGVIINISSLAAQLGGHHLAYEVSKAAVNRLTVSVAQGYARYGIRCNAVQPGLMDTPMAVAGIAALRGIDEAKIRAERDALVPLGRKMGTAWDTANAALFLASDEARFITGVILPVDGGMGISAT